jgi:putative ABC transport system substrate-binding protein
MMVSPTPDLMKVTTGKGNSPDNLFGVCDNLDYIDTSFMLIPDLLKPKHNNTLNIGMLYNQSEPQSKEALNKIRELAKTLHVNVTPLPVSSGADVLLATQSLLAKNIDAFFANPDNIVFGSFETILKACNKHNVPVFTSEAGLVARGAVAAYGADIYQWGFQAGEQAARFLKTGTTEDLHWETVKVRNQVYNEKAAKQFNLNFSENGNDKFISSEQ